MQELGSIHRLLIDFDMGVALKKLMWACVWLWWGDGEVQHVSLEGSVICFGKILIKN